MGIPQILRAFLRVFCAMSVEELEEMAIEAAESDGRLARCPLKNVEREIHAHRRLLLHLDGMIQAHSTAIEQLEVVDDPSSRSMHPFRKEMAKDLLDGELRVLQSARAWVANYCETVKDTRRKRQDAAAGGEQCVFMVVGEPHPHQAVQMARWPPPRYGTQSQVYAVTPWRGS
ncbi:hypothetical protein GUJ93_ZPchr0007g5774 [Zizania palustris]|uniref:Rubisco LSMT substrate-binding domain-containing protein n=1 Tax=Zizania palustris TaxID=103762 RepID=A0A8J5T612_ZIZPA|nr:hypothetical protein GUJ93_ZPchr0007g5774 [Zizania palustris]